jgi:hypothetical protein
LKRAGVSAGKEGMKCKTREDRKREVRKEINEK